MLHCRSRTRLQFSAGHEYTQTSGAHRSSTGRGAGGPLMKTTHEKIRVTFLRASALFAMLAASAAWAQGAPAAGPQTTAADPQASATDASSAGGLQEITVTATHVSESVNRVPITISAVTQANLDQAGILDANQLSAVV